MRTYMRFCARLYPKLLSINPSEKCFDSVEPSSYWHANGYSAIQEIPSNGKKLSLSQPAKAHRVVRRRGSHIFS
jgi:hypothetical protein